MSLILGVDPGLRHTGVVILDEKGIVRYRKTVLLEGEGVIPVTEAFKPIITELRHIDDFGWEIDTASVEQVGWYGKPKRIMLPLSHVAGVITGFLLAHQIPVYLLYARQKIATMRFSRKRGEIEWDQHQRDAAILARVVLNYQNAERSQDMVYLKKHANVQKYKIEPVPW